MEFSSSNSDRNEDDLDLALESAEEAASLSPPAEVAWDVASSENDIMVSSGCAIEELSDPDRNLFQGIDDYDAAAVQQAIRDGADVNCVHTLKYTDTTPLSKACLRADHDGYDKIVRILLDAGANARWKDSSGFSAFAEACWYGHLSIVEMLLNHDNGVLEIASNAGWTPLLTAICYGRTHIVWFLLNRGANVHATDDWGHTTLMRACEENGNLEIVRLLLAAGVDVAAVNKSQRTALHYAVQTDGGIHTLRELILEHNANMFVVDENGNTLFDIAVEDDDVVVPDFLLQLYGSNVTEDHGRLALHTLLTVAEYSNAGGRAFHPPLLPLRIRVPLGKLKLNHFRTLLHHLDADSIRHRDDSGKLPIHIACQANAPVEVLAMLGEMDPATLRRADHSGNLPLHECCCGTVDYSSALCLVEKGGVGNLAARNHQGALPLHVLVASTNPTLRTVQYLIQSFPAAVTARTTHDGQYPFMIAAGESSSASLSVVFEIVRANPNLIVPL